MAPLCFLWAHLVFTLSILILPPSTYFSHCKGKSAVQLWSGSKLWPALYPRLRMLTHTYHILNVGYLHSTHTAYSQPAPAPYHVPCTCNRTASMQGVYPRHGSSPQTILTIVSWKPRHLLELNEDSLYNVKPQPDYDSLLDGRSTVFNNDLGTLPGICELNVGPGASLVAMPGHCLTAAIQDEVKKCLNHNSVLSSVDELTPWLPEPSIVEKGHTCDLRLCLVYGISIITQIMFLLVSARSILP